MTIQKHNQINVLRDDLLPGGTKSILMPSIVNDSLEYVYASPVYGGFQIALAEYCQSAGKKATIFCAKRKQMHRNTLRCKRAGAEIIEINYGYLSNIESKAKQYCKETGAKEIEFGAASPEHRIIIERRVRNVIESLGGEPEEIFCAIGSGMLVESILAATTTATITGVIVGKEYNTIHVRLRKIRHHLPFDKESSAKAPFPSMPNYDLKAWEYCNLYHQTQNVLFWNVL